MKIFGKSPIDAQARSKFLREHTGVKKGDYNRILDEKIKEVGVSVSNAKLYERENGQLTFWYQTKGQGVVSVDTKETLAIFTQENGSIKTGPQKPLELRSDEQIAASRRKVYRTIAKVIVSIAVLAALGLGAHYGLTAGGQMPSSMTIFGGIGAAALGTGGALLWIYTREPKKKVATVEL